MNNQLQFFSSSSSDSEDEFSDERIDTYNNLEFPRLAGWCYVLLNDIKTVGEVVAIKEQNVSVRIRDFSKPIKEWEIIELTHEQIKPVISPKTNSLNLLLSSLKDDQTLITPEIEQAIRVIDRQFFCSEKYYLDTAPNIGCANACISAPRMHICAAELSFGVLKTAKRILDVGSGSGYMTALYAYLAPDALVTGIEYEEALITESKENIDRLCDQNPNIASIKDRITIIQGDGEQGKVDTAPYDIIHAGFMTKKIPENLIKQLAPNGKILIPIGGSQLAPWDPRCASGEYHVGIKLEDGTFEDYRAFSCIYVTSLTSNLSADHQSTSEETNPTMFSVNSL